MKIAEIMLSARFGGAERLFVDIALALAERGHSVLAVCHPDFEALPQLNHPGVSKAFLICHWDWSPVARFRLKLHLQRFGAQVIHTHLARAAAVGGDAGRRLDLPTVANLHNYVNLKYYRSIDWFCPGTEDQKSYLVEQGIASDRIKVVPHFSRLPVEKPLSCSELQGCARRPVFVSYGRFVAKKGFHLLIEALAILRDRGVAAGLVLGGDGPERQHLQALVNRRGLDEAVRFHGWVDDVPSFLDQSPWFVLPSLDEPFGIVMLEAMARGKVIVSTATQGPREVLDEESAFMCSPADPHALADKMAEAVFEPGLARTKAVRAHNLYLEKYSPDCLLPVYEEMFAALATSGALLMKPDQMDSEQK